MIYMIEITAKNIATTIFPAASSPVRTEVFLGGVLLDEPGAGLGAEVVV